MISEASEETAEAPHPERAEIGVHTFRGRTLEDIIPQVHEALGADAVILREREGLVGGVGGFFAQRLIEVDARSAAPSIEVHADETRPQPGTAPAPPAPDPEVVPDEPVIRHPRWLTLLPDDAHEPQQADANEDSVDLTHEEPVSDIPSLASEPPALAPKPQAEPETTGLTEQQPPVRSVRQRPRSLSTPGSVPVPAPPRRTVQLPGVPAAVAGPLAGDAITPQLPLQLPSDAITPQLPLPLPSDAITPHRPLPQTVPTKPRRRTPAAILRNAITRMRHGGRLTGGIRLVPPQPLDAVAADAIAGELAIHGASPSWVSQLIATAGAHGNPLTGSLRVAAEAEIARRLVPAPSLPAEGAVIAFVGAGGSGKTRCTASLASAYRSGSTLTISVVALDSSDNERELRQLLKGVQVPVRGGGVERANRLIAQARRGGLVIIDTPAMNPTDPAAISALSARLQPLALDAIYVTLPATLGPQAALQVLSSFSALQPAAVAITHADETDQLAVAIELLTSKRIPLAYIHAGTDHHGSISQVDPVALAHRLLA